jgi:cytidylate kinase
MGYIITIGRQFGSGGRELGRRLADELGIAYYDREILLEVEKRTDYSLNYIENVSEDRPIILPPINYGNSFMVYRDVNMEQSNDVHAMQAKFLKEAAEKSSCVIIGRGADYILRDKKPYRIFVYADMESRLKRCRTRQRENEAKMSDKKFIRFIKSIDKKRRQFYDFYTGIEWGEKSNYDLMINTSNVDIKQLAHNLALLIKDIYAEQEKKEA